MSTQRNIEVRILADSINPAGVRLTSWLLRYPRFIHSELMTHRCFSRNAASSRAIPLQRMVDEISEGGVALPERWGTKQAGMQSGAPGDENQELAARVVWKSARTAAVCGALQLDSYGIHKSIANRLLEPFAHMVAIFTATDHANFFKLRAHPDAQPEFQVLAYRMLAAYVAATPEPCAWGQWHIPRFGNLPAIVTALDAEVALKVATARCARLSYLTYDGEHSTAKDIELHDRLLASGHMSPFEHCAQADPRWDNRDNGPVLSNFDRQEAGDSGWLQYRKTLPDECARGLDYAAALAAKPAWVAL